MSIGQSLGIQGVLLGSFILAAFGWIVSANAAPLPSFPASEARSVLPSALFDTEAKVGFEASVSLLPPMVERLDSSSPELTAQSDPSSDHAEDMFEASIAYTPELTNDNQLSGGSVDGQECRVSNLFPEGILQWCDLITRYADQHELEPDLIASVMLQESGGQPQAYSHSGAVGLMQVMPRDGIAQKFMCKNGPCFSSRPTISELEDPEFNIAYGTRMLSGLNSRFGSIRDALKSYGPMDVGYSYADKVLAIFERNRN